jgi:hypothetical protein
LLLRARVHKGEVVELVFATDRLHFVDPDSDDAIAPVDP